MFPDHLIQPVHISGPDRLSGRVHIDLCALCALEMRNRIFELPEGMSFQGEIELARYEEALRAV